MEKQGSRNAAGKNNRSAVNRAGFRPLSQLNLMDDFLFHEAVTHGAEGEEFCRILLRTVLGHEIGRVRIVPQRSYQGIDTRQRGIRLDVYIEENIETDDGVETAALYDVEPTLYDLKDTLPKRMRFYQAMMDARTLSAGESYRKLPRTIIIFILPKDYFGKGRMMYTFRTVCEEDSSVVCDDESRRIVLYTKGNPGSAGQKLAEMLQYFMKTTPDNAANSELRKIDAMVDEIKQNAEVRRAYMQAWDKELYLKEEGEQAMCDLIARLASEGREQEIVKAAADRDYREQLMRQYGLRR